MNPETQSVGYRRALEALRSGVPNADAVRVLGSNQANVEQLFLERLASMGDAVAGESQVPGLLMEGGFGTGKSHLLKYLQDKAVSENFVCSHIVISKETPLYDPAKVYRAAIEAAVVPHLRGQAIQEIALSLRQDTPSYAELYKWANRDGSGLGAMFPATLLLHERLRNDPELVEEITNFWSGDKLSVARVRQGLRQISQAATFHVKRIPVRELALQLFTFAPRLMLAAGYRGWVLLFDEVELAGRYSALQRGKSYAELARWMGQIEGEEYPGLMAVMTIVDDFAYVVLEQKGDRDSVGPRLRGKDTDEFRILAAQAEVGMRIIEHDAVSLVAPDDSVLEQTYLKLKDIHARAHGWEPPQVDLDIGTKRAMRSHVRRWINEWDLKRLFPEAAISTEEQEVRPSYEEDLDFEQSSKVQFGADTVEGIDDRDARSIS